MCGSPSLQHLLQHVLPFLGGLLHSTLLVTDVPQLAGRVRLHGLASAPLFSRTSHNAGLLNVKDKEFDSQLNSFKQLKCFCQVRGKGNKNPNTHIAEKVTQCYKLSRLINVLKA